MGKAELAGATILCAARQHIGVRFVLRGRDPRRGLDCVGLVAVAFATSGCELCVPDAYPMRGWGADRVAQWIARSGLCEVLRAKAGDVLLDRMAFGQWHVGIVGSDAAGAGTLVHAHAGLRRVVEMPLSNGADARFFRHPFLMPA